jgi:hypothetical protein
MFEILHTPIIIKNNCFLNTQTNKARVSKCRWLFKKLKSLRHDRDGRLHTLTRIGLEEIMKTDPPADAGLNTDPPTPLLACATPRGFNCLKNICEKNKKKRNKSTSSSLKLIENGQLQRHIMERFKKWTHRPEGGDVVDPMQFSNRPVVNCVIVKTTFNRPSLGGVSFPQSFPTPFET